MIESLAAISLAGNVVQFVDFAIRLSQEAKRIRRTKPRGEDQCQTNDLKQIGLQLDIHASAFEFPESVRNVLNGQISKEQVKSSSWFRRARPDQSRQSQRQDVYNQGEMRDMEISERLDADKVAQLSPCDQDIVRMCLDCHDIAVDLRNAVARLRTANATAWESFHAALKTIRSEKDLENLRQRLRDHRQKITILLIGSLRGEVQRSRRVATDQNEDLLQATERIRGRLELLFEAKDDWKSEVLQEIRSSFQSITGADNPLIQHNQRYHNRLTFTSQNQFRDSILKWIGFSELNHRYKKIESAYKETFEWIFRQPPDGKWSNFQLWLESENQSFYWITGKPAAGKSTLLKFIYQDPRTKENLAKWSGQRRLVRTAFYFWNSGTVMEMSEEAMIRTLLHGALSDDPELWAFLFPSKMEEFLLFTDPWRQPLTYEEVENAFKLLVDGAGDKYRLFLFIDGLDEFGGDHQTLVTRIKSLKSPDVKVCFSSRAWTVFEDGFPHLPRLRLEDLTYNDIRHYVTNRFHGNDGFKDRRLETPRQADDLIEAVTVKACGVFLWVVLVTDSLLKGFTAGERLEELNERLNTVPRGLEELFEKILTYVDLEKRKEMAQILQIMRYSPENLTLLDLSYAEDLDPDIVSKVMIEGPNPSPIPVEARSRTMHRRLRACCQGLIEADAAPNEPLASASVTYLHRTVRDWFETESILSQYRDMTDSTFCPWTSLFNTYAIRLKQQATTMWCRPAHEGDEYFWKNILYAIDYAVHTGSSQDRKLSVKLLMDLDTIATQLAQVKGHNNEFLIEQSFGKSSLEHWSASRKTGRFNTSFLHLAIQLQLTDVVNHIQSQQEVSPPPKPNIPSRATLNLLLATLSNDLFAKNQPNPLLTIYPCLHSATLVARFLEQGADPNHKIDNALRDYGNITGEYSPWEAHLRSQDRESKVWMEMSTLFLQHGADPVVIVATRTLYPDEIVALAQEKMGKMQKRSKRQWVTKLMPMPKVRRLRMTRMAVLSSS
ncbi:predicted protein [Plenodomus lingam JN3]|uniref:Predicted protein n=1 Tax=Leptosphaeria maculans (strain JN3 / isolate v23.1.3 / race Av1-4-5-6-7-8) TaxID=985895 RepID=E4ZYT1_LEPMJ|nr:predicted protein [Plenodomus lingam JN3]CBX96607.1 predicted protein [Plenodomus lingam JN3]